MTQQNVQEGTPLGEILSQWLPGDVAEVRVTGLCLDHRWLRPGDLFVALPGSRSDGRNYIANALKAGAAAVLKEAEGEKGIAWHGPAPIIGQADLTSQVSAVADRFYGEPSRHMAVVGVTGTNGKSTCSHLLAQLHHILKGPAAVMGTLGYGPVDGDFVDTGLTTADPIANQAILADLRRRGMASVAMEVSSHSLDQQRVAAIRFRQALLTNLSRDHLDYHGDMAAYGAAKRKLFLQPGLRQRIINLDDPFGRQLVGEFRAGESAETWTYSREDAGADVYLTESHLGADGLSGEVRSPWGTGWFHSALLGDFSLSNLLAVITACGSAGMPLDQVLGAVGRLRPVRGRMERVSERGDPAVIVDYAHTPDSLGQALRALRPHTRGQLHCVFGCGGDRDRGKRPLMAGVAEQLADRVIVTSDNPRGENQRDIAADIRAGFRDPERIEFIEDRGAAIESAVSEAGLRDCVLIAGKGHEEYQQVGDARLPFSDVTRSRLALRRRAGRTQGAE